MFNIISFQIGNPHYDCHHQHQHFLKAEKAVKLLAFNFNVSNYKMFIIFTATILTWIIKIFKLNYAEPNKISLTVENLIECWLFSYEYND